jgi:hypothetical protein
MGKNRRAIAVENKFRREWEAINGVDLKIAEAQIQIIMSEIRFVSLLHQIVLFLIS